MHKYKPLYLLMPFWLISVGLIQAQAWKLAADSAIEISITGTSSLHDWKVTSSDVQGVPTQITLGNDQKQIAFFSFKVPVEEMDGGRGSSMNNKILEAFKSTEHPFVQYTQTGSADVVKSGESHTISSTGTLSMAGVDKPISVICTATVKNGELIISGNQKIKMTDYNMIPPSAMFGQIKTHDGVVVNYQFRYVKQ